MTQPTVPSADAPVDVEGGAQRPFHEHAAMAPGRFPAAG